MRQKVIVIGGGLIGTSAAYYLSKAGAQVTLLEAHDIAAGTSGACDRAIMMQSKAPGPLLQLALESARMYQDLEEELEADLEYRKGGGMIVFETPEEREAIRSLVLRQREAGLDVQLISAEEARQRQPGLSSHILGSTWWEHDAEVNPLNVSFALARGAKRLGASIRLQAKVTRLLAENERITGVEVSGEALYADAVVVALGVWTPHLLSPLGLDVPIIPRRGQILVSERLPPFVEGNVLGAAYITSKLSKNGGGTGATESAGVGLSLGQTNSGTLLIGGSREFKGYELETSVEITRAIGQAAVRLFPSLANVRILRTFAGLRPFTPDGKPIIGNVPELAGLFVAAGHEGDGVALSPVTGRLIANVVTGVNPEFDLSPFSLARFRATATV